MINIYILDVEDKIYSYWEKNEFFKPKENSKKFSVVIPPPNVTGSFIWAMLK